MGDLEQRVAVIEDTLEQVRLLAEHWKRSRDYYVRIMGADLAQILDGAEVKPYAEASGKDS